MAGTRGQGAAEMTDFKGTAGHMLGGWTPMRSVGLEHQKQTLVG